MSTAKRKTFGFVPLGERGFSCPISNTDPYPEHTTTSEYVVQHTREDGQWTGYCLTAKSHDDYQLLFGTDYPEPCELIISLGEGSGNSETLRIGSYGLEEKLTEISEGYSAFEFPYYSSSIYTLRKTEESPKGALSISWTNTRRARASISSNSFTGDSGGTIFYLPSFDCTLLIPEIPFDIDGNFYGFPRYTGKNVAPEYDGGFWVMDNNFYGFPHVKNSGVAPEYDGGFWTMDGNFYGFPYIKKSGIAPEYVSPEPEEESTLYFGNTLVVDLYFDGQPVNECYYDGVLVYKRPS